MLCDKAFTIGSDTQYNRHQRRLASVVHKFFDKKAGDTTPAGA